MSRANQDLSEEIRAYWGRRADSFDQSFAHAIAAGAEFSAWAQEIERHLPPAPARVLELGCGTGEVTRVILSLGHQVTGLDFTPEMLARAKAKHAGNAQAKFYLADAQNTMEPDAAYDAVIARHLTWTLTDPKAAYRDWLRVLRPGGRVVLFDGDWARESRITRALSPIIRWLGRNLPPDPVDAEMTESHNAIMASLPYGEGLSARRLATDLKDAGFVGVTVHSHARVTRGMGKNAPLARRIRLRRWRRFIVSASAPQL
ncbi:class I SAM-dependent methyltransferase [Falsigemmobacter intermedius]|uniref:Class I SAM-dependent methyltransferase n=1 Tax=Falsigemmobacter intermedius TaxID=1553448 RepID=A0A3S3UYW0_9RHOB|nr:class I SAM-dependent methyltransferase [Falsigemmobacter intermedius]RWY38841.1 class I SAM-dependent methyltransferase [Falsigemmobacter intermedius]